MRVLVLDGILDRDDVPGVAPVDLLDERGQRRGLAGARGAADEDEAAGQARQCLRPGGQPQRREAGRLRRERAHGRRGPAALPVEVDPEPPDAAHAVRGIGDAGVAVLGAGVRRERRQHRFLDLLARQRRLGKRGEATVDAHGRRRAGD